MFIIINYQSAVASMIHAKESQQGRRLHDYSKNYVAGSQ